MAGVGSKPTGGILSLRLFYRIWPSSWTLNAAYGLDIHQWKTSVISRTQKVVRSKLTVISVSLAHPLLHPIHIPIPCSSAAERLTHRPLPLLPSHGTTRGWLSPYKRKVTGSKPVGGIPLTPFFLLIHHFLPNIANSLFLIPYHYPLTPITSRFHSHLALSLHSLSAYSLYSYSALLNYLGL